MVGLVHAAPVGLPRLARISAAVALAAAFLSFHPSLAGAAVQTEDLTLQTKDTPKLRLEQTGTGGFSPQTWDVAGNEANFFIRDVTGGSLLPFRIRPGAPTSSVDIAADGDVGIGTATPKGSLEISRSGAADVRYTVTAPNPDLTWATGVPADGGSFTIGLSGAALPALSLVPSGDTTAAGSLAELASQANVSGTAGVDAASILQKVGALPVSSWSFSASPGTRHLGPLAGDFSAAFGLGNANAVAPADVAGVALVAVQGLIAENRSLSARLGKAETEAAEAKAAAAKPVSATNAKLAKKVRNLGKQMKKLRKAVAKLGG